MKHVYKTKPTRTAVCLFVCLAFNGTFSTISCHRRMKYILCRAREKQTYDKWTGQTEDHVPWICWYQDFSLLGAKVLSGNLRSQERKFPGTFAPGNKCSREQMFPGTFVLGILTSLSDHGSGCLCYSESKLKKYSKINANTYLYYCWLRLRTFAHC